MSNKAWALQPASASASATPSMTPHSSAPRTSTQLAGSASHHTKDVDAELREAYRTILRCIGEDPSRPGLLQTPARAAKAIKTLTSGYVEDPRIVAGSALFPVVDDPRQSQKQSMSMDVCHPVTDLETVAAADTALGMVLVKDININSLCEHHLLPFYGRAHIGYLPGKGAVLGLSKLARIADALARRLQMQERLTQQICDALMDVASASGAAVVIECSHMCMCSRGVKQVGALTVTSAMRGAFKNDPELRQEFWQSLGQQSRSRL